MFRPQSGQIIRTKFHPATSMYLSNGTCQHWPSYAIAEVDVADPCAQSRDFVSVVQQADEEDHETVARAKGMFLRGVRGMYGFKEH